MAFYADFFQKLQPWQRKNGPAYEALFSIGSGSFGTVQVAKSNTSLGRVAVKAMSLRDASGKSSRSRAESAWHEVHHTQHILKQQQQHMAGNGLTVHGSQFICTVHEVFFDKDTCKVMLAMELADRTLLSEIRRYQVFSDEEVRVFMVGLLRALQWLGHCQVCHNDITPSNVLLFKPPMGDAFTWQVKLSDFGSSSSPKRPRQMVTTFNYAAPEMLRFVNSLALTGHGIANAPCPYTHASDVWSVGVILSELLSEDACYCVVTSTDDPKMSKAEGFLSGISSMLSTMHAKLDLEGSLDHTCLSNSGLSLASHMLQQAPSERICPNDALKHAWFKNPTPLTCPTGHGGSSKNPVFDRAGLAIARAYALLSGIRGCPSA